MVNSKKLRMLTSLPHEVLEIVLYRTIQPYLTIDRVNEPMEDYWKLWNGDSRSDVLFRIINHTPIGVAIDFV